MTKACSLACGLPFCHSAQKASHKQTNLSLGLRVAAIALGIIAAVAGVLILCGIGQLSHVMGWSMVVAGGVSIILGASIKCIDNKFKNNSSKQNSDADRFPNNTIIGQRSSKDRVLPDSAKEEQAWEKILSQRSEKKSFNIIRESFASFIGELETEIFPFYESHEKTFDKCSIHGRMHIARAIIFCEVMARYFQHKGLHVDFPYVRRTTGLHDAGRKNNGLDQWEQESSNLLFTHLKSKGMSDAEAFLKSSIIIKNKQNDSKSLEFQIFQSADCLDIMRPCTGRGGRAGFKTEYLTFLKDATPESPDHQFRQQLIEEAWEFIQITEAKKDLGTFKNNEGFMAGLFNIINNNRDKFKILSCIL